jgi:hypothetical protein
MEVLLVGSDVSEDKIEADIADSLKGVLNHKAVVDIALGQYRKQIIPSIPDSNVINVLLSNIVEYVIPIVTEENTGTIVSFDKNVACMTETYSWIHVASGVDVSIVGVLIGKVAPLSVDTINTGSAIDRIFSGTYTELIDHYRSPKGPRYTLIMPGIQGFADGKEYNDKKSAKPGVNAEKKAEKKSDKSEKKSDKSEKKSDKSEKKSDKSEKKSDKSEKKSDKSEKKSEKKTEKKGRGENYDKFLSQIHGGGLVEGGIKGLEKDRQASQRFAEKKRKQVQRKMPPGYVYVKIDPASPKSSIIDISNKVISIIRNRIRAASMSHIYIDSLYSKFSSFKGVTPHRPFELPPGIYNLVGDYPVTSWESLYSLTGMMDTRQFVPFFIYNLNEKTRQSALDTISKRRELKSQKYEDQVEINKIMLRETITNQVACKTYGKPYAKLEERERKKCDVMAEKKLTTINRPNSCPHVALLNKYRMGDISKLSELQQFFPKPKGKEIGNTIECIKCRRGFFCPHEYDEYKKNWIGREDDHHVYCRVCEAVLGDKTLESVSFVDSVRLNNQPSDPILEMIMDELFSVIRQNVVFNKILSMRQIVRAAAENIHQDVAEIYSKLNAIRTMTEDAIISKFRYFLLAYSYGTIPVLTSNEGIDLKVPRTVKVPPKRDKAKYLLFVMNYLFKKIKIPLKADLVKKIFSSASAKMMGIDTSKHVGAQGIMQFLAGSPLYRILVQYAYFNDPKNQDKYLEDIFYNYRKILGKDFGEAPKMKNFIGGSPEENFTVQNIKDDKLRDARNKQDAQDNSPACIIIGGDKLEVIANAAPSDVSISDVSISDVSISDGITSEQGYGHESTNLPFGTSGGSLQDAPWEISDKIGGRSVDVKNLKKNVVVRNSKSLNGKKAKGNVAKEKTGDNSSRSTTKNNAVNSTGNVTKASPADNTTGKSTGVGSNAPNKSEDADTSSVNDHNVVIDASEDKSTDVSEEFDDILHPRVFGKAILHVGDKTTLGSRSICNILRHNKYLHHPVIPPTPVMKSIIDERQDLIWESYKDEMDRRMQYIRPYQKSFYSGSMMPERPDIKPKNDVKLVLVPKEEPQPYVEPLPPVEFPKIPTGNQVIKDMCHKLSVPYNEFVNLGEYSNITMNDLTSGTVNPFLDDSDKSRKIGKFHTYNLGLVKYVRIMAYVKRVPNPPYIIEEAVKKPIKVNTKHIDDYLEKYYYYSARVDEEDLLRFLMTFFSENILRLFNDSPGTKHFAVEYVRKIMRAEQATTNFQTAKLSKAQRVTKEQSGDVGVESNSMIDKTFDATQEQKENDKEYGVLDNEGFDFVDGENGDDVDD